MARVAVEELLDLARVALTLDLLLHFEQYLVACCLWGLGLFFSTRTSLVIEELDEGYLTVHLFVAINGKRRCDKLLIFVLISRA